MGYFNEFPHTRGYDGDLGWLIMMYKQLLAYYKNIDSTIADNISETLNQWLNDGTIADLINESIFNELNQKIDYLSNYVTLEMFEAKGDGITDDSNAFSQALKSGKDILLLKKYNIGSVQIENDNLCILGTQGATLIGDLTVNAHDVIFQNFTIQAKTSFCMTLAYNKYLTKYDSSNLFNNIIFIGINNCIIIGNNDRNNVFNKCQVNNASSIAIDGMNSTDNRYINSSIYSSADGLRIGNNNFIDNCNLYDFKGTAIQLFGNNNTVNCDIQNSVNGIYINSNNYNNYINVTLNTNADFEGENSNAITIEGNNNEITARCGNITNMLISGANKFTGNIIKLFGSGNLKISNTTYQNNAIIINGVSKRNLKQVGQIVSTESATDVLDYDFMVLIIDYTDGTHTTHTMRRRGSTQFTFFDGSSHQVVLNFGALGTVPYFVSGSPCTITFYAYA